MGKPRSGVLLNPAARAATGRERRSGDLRRRQSAPSALLPALASGLRRPLRIVLEVTTAGLTAFSPSFRCTLRVFSKIAFTTSTLSHVLGQIGRASCRERAEIAVDGASCANKPAGRDARPRRVE